MNFKKTLKVLAASVLLFGSVGLATSCGEEKNVTTDVGGMVLNQNGKVIREDFELAKAYKGCELTWTSNNESVAKIEVAEDGTITCKITRPSSRTEVTLKATSGKYSKEYNIIVPAVDASEMADEYSFAHDKKTLTTGEYDLENSTTYSGVSATISWSISDEYKSIATIKDGKLIVTAQEEVKDTIKLVAEFAVGSETSKITYTVYTMDSKPIDSVSQLETNKAYVLYINHKTKGTNYFFTGEMSGYYGGTAEDINKGWDIYAEEVSGGYNLSFTDANNKKQYINVVVSGTYVNFKVEDEASSVWTWDAEYKTVKTQATDGNTYYIGCTTKYATIQPFKDPAANYPLVFVEASKKSNNNENAPKVDTEYKLFINQKGSSKELYFAGSLNSSGYGVASENASEGVDVKLETNGSGYNMYFMDGTSKKYIVAEDGGLNSKGFQTYKFNISDSASCVWNYNTTYDTMTTTIVGNEVYIGTYGSYDTFSVSVISYAPTSYTSQLVKISSSNGSNEGNGDSSNGGGGESSNEATTITIKEALGKDEGTEVIVEGKITVVGDGQYTIKDNSGSIIIYGAIAEIGDKTLAVGDKIKVKGERAIYKPEYAQSEAQYVQQINKLTLLDYEAAPKKEALVYDDIKFTAASTLTISGKTGLDNATFTKEYQKWSLDGVTLENEKASSTNDVYQNQAATATYVRLYAASNIKISGESSFKAIKITFADKGKALLATDLIENANIAVSEDGLSCIIVLDEASTSFELNGLARQIRICSISLGTIA